MTAVRWIMKRIAVSLTLLAGLALGGPEGAGAESTVLTIGYSPTLTQAPALIAQNMAAEGQGWFERYLPEGVRINWQAFGAGPQAMEAMAGGLVEVAYAGASPILETYLRTDGGVVAAAGALRGGSALVVPRASLASGPADFIGKRVATPQQGSTQNRICQFWLARGGLKAGTPEKPVEIVPVASHNLLTLFRRGGVDAAWTVEPWVSRLETEAGGRILTTGPPGATLSTALAFRAGFWRLEPDLSRRIVQAHRELLEWIVRNPEEARRRLADELTRQTRRQFPLAIVERAWPRLTFDPYLNTADFLPYLVAAREAGVNAGTDDLRGLVPAR